MYNAIVSVTDKTGLNRLIPFLWNRNFNIFSTGGTYSFIESIANEPGNEKYKTQLHRVSDVTKFPEMLNGRVKTLHPNILGGVLASHTLKSHMEELSQHNIPKFSLVVDNLYQFQKTVESGASHDDIIENIDIGGPTLIRAAAKNYKSICVLTNPEQYKSYMDEIVTVDESCTENCDGDYEKVDIDYEKIGENFKFNLARDAFNYIANYDNNINSYFNKDIVNLMVRENRKLKYGMNPNNKSAAICSINDESAPFLVLNGNIGYINALDAIGSWRLVNEIETVLGKNCCASFKHTIPTGVAVRENNEHRIDSVCDVYKRARNVDPLSSFGDFVAYSGHVDEEAADYISKVVSDGIIAGSYSQGAIELLCRKKGGNYVVLLGNQIDFTKSAREYRSMYGLSLVQDYDNSVFDKELLNNIVTYKRDTSPQNIEDMIIASVSLKYAQSNSIAFAHDGQLIGLGAGQQNRLDCIRLAGQKAQLWFMRNDSHFNECVNIELAQTGKTDMTKQEKITFMYEYSRNLSVVDSAIYRSRMKNVVMSSDGFLPFADNIEEAKKYGVTHVVNPGGSNGDDGVTTACDKYGMVMFHTGRRLFFH